MSYFVPSNQNILQETNRGSESRKLNDLHVSKHTIIRKIKVKNKSLFKMYSQIFCFTTQLLGVLYNERCKFYCWVIITLASNGNSYNSHNTLKTGTSYALSTWYQIKVFPNKSHAGINCKFLQLQQNVSYNNEWKQQANVYLLLSSLEKFYYLILTDPTNYLVLDFEILSRQDNFCCLIHHPNRLSFNSFSHPI